MGVSIKTLACHGRCRDCYESDIRRLNPRERLNTKAVVGSMKRAITETYGKGGGRACRPSVCLHGGEPLMIEMGAMREVLEAARAEGASLSIQTGGGMMTDRHVELFREFRVSVGFSIDGDTAALNRGRHNGWAMTDAEIQTATDRTISEIEACRDAGLSVSVISCLRPWNAGPTAIKEFIRFLLRLRMDFGIAHVRTNESIVFDDPGRAERELEPSVLAAAFQELADICLGDPALSWQPYRDIVDAMTGHPDVTCVFTGCDPWRTSAETTIMASGGLGVCLKPAAGRDGIASIRAERPGYERTDILRLIPESEGGCRDCRYWPLCHGGCPGAAIDNDWRNRTRFCEAYKSLFSHIEKKLLGLMPNIVTAVDFRGRCTASDVATSIVGSTWRRDRRRTPDEIRKPEKGGQNDDRGALHGDGHGDMHGDSHGDRPHGDHGDSNEID